MKSKIIIGIVAAVAVLGGGYTVSRMDLPKRSGINSSREKFSSLIRKLSPMKLRNLAI